MTSQNEEKSKEEEKKTNNKPKWQKSYFDVLGLCCTSEVPIIDNILKSLDGVKEYSVIVPSRTVIVVHDTLLISPLQIAKALNQARLEANVKVTGDTKFKNKWPSPFAVVSGLLLLLSFLKYVYPPLHWLAVAAVACGIYPILAKAVASIRRLRVDINILVIITVIATLAMQDFMEAAAVVFLFTIAEWLETRASYKATSVMQSLMSLAPQKAVIAETGEEVEVNDVNIHTILAVKAGETVPIDGIVVDGNCEVDEKTLTGEAFPVPKQIDSTVFAGTINLNGYISVKTTALASDCVVAKMAKLVEEAQSSKTKSQRLIDKCSLYYTPIIVIISASIAAIPTIMKLHNLNHWFHLALVVLVSACPCGLILSTPVATFCALTKAATSGLLIKSADYLDTLSKIKTVAFDKTGTITRGEFIVVDFKLLSSDISLHNLVYWVSSVESKSSHPMAATLVDYARTVSIEPRPEEVLDYKNFPGEGIYGNIDGNDIYIGNKRIASRAMCSTETEVDTKGGKTIGYVYVGERLAGVFNLSDACRSGVAQAIKELKDLGIKTAMLTGDNQESANHAQEELENALDAVHGDLLPEDKSKIIQDFKKQGKTAMVGDGINDAPALATADIGISMGVSGSALATQTGHIILMSNDIRRIPKAIKLARRAQRKVVQNVFISITLKAGILALAIAGHPLIWAAVLVDVATCLIVILNSMLLLREKDRSKDKKCYRASTNGQKLDGCDEQGIDLEAGLLKNGQCNSGCCGDKKKQQKAMAVAKPSSHDHSHSGGCCGDKNTQQKVMARQGTKPSSDHSHSGGCCGDKNTPQKVMTIQGTKPSSDHSHSGGCCGDKNTQQKVMARQGTKPSSDHSHSGGCCGDKNTPQKVMTIQGTKPSSDHSHSGGCCGDKNTQQKVMAKPSSDHSHSGGCFGDKKQENVKLVKDGCCGEKTKKPERELASLSSCKKSSHTHNDMKMKSGSSCCANKSEKGKETVAKSCCEEKKPHAEKNIAMQILGHDKTGLDIEAGVSCGDTKGEVREHFELKSEGRCKTSCCGDEKETGEITLASEEKTDSVDCSLGCCKEEVNQSCHEKTCPVTETDASCGLKLACCDHTEGEVREEGEIVKASSQGCCTRSPSDHLVLPALQVKKVESCCNVKKSQEEACGSKCSEREKLHIGKSCCRSYAKEYCSHRHHHGHHHGHHHHHHHVGAA